MGAAGLTSSSAEMAARGGVGVEIDLSLVPTREPGMTPYEILLSESQERMLVVAKHDRVAQVQAIAAKWELAATPIGRVTDDGMYRCTWGAQVVVEIPGRAARGRLPGLLIPKLARTRPPPLCAPSVPLPTPHSPASPKRCFACSIILRSHRSAGCSSSTIRPSRRER